MDWISFGIDLILHLDRYLDLIIRSFGLWTYLILFIVIFIETGLVVTPFLPGDSLLFAAGAFAAKGSFNVSLLFFMLWLAAVLGDTANYWIGHFVGPRVFRENVRWLKREYLERTQAFYDKHGGKTIFLARFIPIIRTFAPFVAGIGQMRYGYFITYNIVGGLVWTALFIFGGYFFGNLPFVKNNFSFIIIAIILISVLPAVLEAVRNRRAGVPAAQPKTSVEQ
ncbi:MAG: DedA family protein [Thermanaerothrix sp.]|uniref:DedA family protein n=1 Tax=Thermanaerothrix solaris TaxID=3058434 RepID=A0ABU3NNT9_9CHLR|nr:DedA family protein [Thermanaerothrix sp. 4228-RoL]MDT8898511.1 DedA family protein [Thermanaerothrix sp. 4228-RoL]